MGHPLADLGYNLMLHEEDSDVRSGTEENRFVDWRVGVEERSGADVWKAVAVAT